MRLCVCVLCVCAPVIVVMLWNWIERVSIDHFPLCVISACCCWQREHEPPAQTQTDKHTHTHTHTHANTRSRVYSRNTVCCLHVLTSCNTLRQQEEKKKSTFLLHNILWKYQHYCPEVVVVETCKNYGSCSVMTDRLMCRSLTTLQGLMCDSKLSHTHTHTHVCVLYHYNLFCQSAVSDNTFRVHKGHGEV